MVTNFCGTKNPVEASRSALVRGVTSLPYSPSTDVTLAAIPAYGSNLGPPCPAAHPVRPALAHIAPVPSNALSATAASNLANGASNGIPAAQSRPAQGTGGPSPYATGGPSQSRGGPPPRLASGGPGAGATGGPVAGTGGPGRRTAMGGVGGVNERTRQMATTKLPPGLQAKLAAVSAIPDLARRLMAGVSVVATSRQAIDVPKSDHARFMDCRWRIDLPLQTPTSTCSDQTKD